MTSEKGEQVKLVSEKSLPARPEYEGVKCCNDDDNPAVFVLKPSMVNPNSYESIRTVLVDVGKQANVYKYGEGKRHFVVIYCDGVPYNLIWRVCNCTYRCASCDVLLTSKTDCEKHVHEDIVWNLTG